MGKLTILSAGYYSSLQDLGRFGFRKYGVPLSGAMDQYSHRLANLLAGNPETSPCIEITVSGLRVHFDTPTVIAITGADMQPNIDQVTMPIHRRMPISTGQTLSLGPCTTGMRCYLAIKGLTSEKILGSYAQYQGVTPKAVLQQGDILHYTTTKGAIALPHARVKNHSLLDQPLQAYPGPEYACIDRKQMQRLLNTPTQVMQNSRMGYQLQPAITLHTTRTIITSPVVPGTIQLTPSGRLLALMRDAQVTGGYPRVLQLTETSINRLSQKRSGEVVKLALTKD